LVHETYLKFRRVCGLGDLPKSVFLYAGYIGTTNFPVLKEKVKFPSRLPVKRSAS